MTGVLGGEEDGENEGFISSEEGKVKVGEREKCRACHRPKPRLV